MAFAKRSVAVSPLMVAHERETGLFQAWYAAKERYRVPDDVRILKRYQWRAIREQRDVRERIVEAITSTFKTGDIIVLTYAGGDNGYFQETRTYWGCGDWHIYTKDGSTTSGHPLVSLLRVETANEEWIGNDS